MKLLRKLWLLLQGRCPTCSSYEHLRHRLWPDMPEARLLTSGWTPRPRRLHGANGCAMIGWCHECDELPPPCCEECRVFGPCSECEDKRKPQFCGDRRCRWARCRAILESQAVITASGAPGRNFNMYDD